MAIVFMHGLYIFLMILPIISSSNPDSEALLRLKASFTNATSLTSWRPGTEPCANGQWVGVTCDNGVVSGLRLTNLGLTGRIDGDALAAISGLRIAAFMFNAFSGPIPNFRATAALKGLYLTGNQFSGPIHSDFFVGKEGLKRVWLSENNFFGPIPASLARLPGLEELHLENNRFSGLIPPFDQQSLVSVNFSNNNLEGEIPPGLTRFGADPFQGNAGLKRRKHRTSEEHLVVAFFSLMACVALLLVMVVVVFLMRRRSRGTVGVDDEPSVKHNLETPLTSGKKLVGGSSKIMNVFGSSVYGRRARGDDLVFMNDEKGSFGMGDMMRAGAEVMRSGALGSSFKTTLAGGMSVVVKRVVRELNKIGRGEFDEKMRLLGSLRHKNVLPPLAYYNGKDEKLLVYEYLHKGSLLLLLHDDQESSPTELEWPLRLKIIQGIANGLEFLHTELSSLDLPHGDLKSSNVLLSVDYEPLLADYGFWSLMGQSPAARSLIAFKAPEVAESSSCISPKCDVYFLGVIILEIVARKFPSQYLSNAQGGIDLVVWARSAVAEGREGEMLDPDVANAGDSVQQMKQLVQIASCCTEDDPDKRLGLKEAVSRIESTLSTVVDDGRGDHEIDLVPSLRDGILHPPAAQSSNINGPRRDNSGDQSGRRSFTFEINS